MQQEEEAIFKFLNPNDNDKLSKMSGLDLQDLLIYIDKYYLSLRDKLGLDKNITIGVELEFEKAVKSKIIKKIDQEFPGDIWKIKEERTVPKGAEINSPILTDTKENWEDLKKICLIISQFAKIGMHSGGHVHIGTQTLGSDRNSWINFLKIWSVYENIIFRFSYGNYITGRKTLYEYAMPMAKSFWHYYEKFVSEKTILQAMISIIGDNRHQAVNFRKVKDNMYEKYCQDNTIEFRCPNGTLNPIIWQNNVNLFARLLCYSKSSLFNNDIIDNRHNINQNDYNLLKWYNEIYLEQALEFADMIYPTNLDKIYFLKQYLKSFKVSKKTDEYNRTVKLTK